jgi:hypothetical protein
LRFYALSLFCRIGDASVAMAPVFEFVAVGIR